MRHLFLLIGVATTALSLGPHHARAAQPSPPSALEVRFYPHQSLRMYEVDALRGWNGALLQNVAVVNRSKGPVTLERIELHVVRGEDTLQTHRLGSADITRAGERGKSLREAGLVERYAFHFRPDLLLGSGVTVGGSATLDPATALLLGQRYLTFSGRPDRIVLRALGRDGAGKRVSGQSALQIAGMSSLTAFGFPVSGRWYIGAGQALHHHHRWVVPEEFALDLAQLGDGGLTHRGDGSRRTDYLAYGKPVLASAEGTVVAAVDSFPESDEPLRRSGETLEDYMNRVRGMQDSLISRGLRYVAGNHVVIQHAGGLSSFYGHLAPGSIRVRAGDRVTRGQPIGKLGFSGNATEPHLHFHVIQGTDPFMSPGVPVRFTGIELPWAEGTRAVQSGDIVVAGENP